MNVSVTSSSQGNFERMVWCDKSVIGMHLDIGLGSRFGELIWIRIIRGPSSGP